jgi:glucose-6-phosphate isomerase
LQFKMIEVMYLAHLLGVNPFDQPAVELYKIETKRLLEEKK